MDARQLWYFRGPVRVCFLFHPFAKSEAIRSALYESIIFIPSVDTVFGCHVLQKGKAVCGNISGGSSDLPQFVFIYKLFSQSETLTLLVVNHASHQMELNRRGRPYHNWIHPNLLHSALKLYITISENSKLEHTANSAVNMNVKHAYCSVDRMEEKNLYSWHNIISMGLLENNSICKDGGGIHYQQLGWNDNTHYTVISLQKAANGSNHSALINRTLSFVSTWRASSIFH